MKNGCFSRIARRNRDISMKNATKHRFRKEPDMDDEKNDVIVDAEVWGDGGDR